MPQTPFDALPRFLIQNPSSQLVVQVDFANSRFVLADRQERTRAQRFLAPWYQDKGAFLLVCEDEDGGLHSVGNPSGAKVPVLDPVNFDDAHLWKVGDGLAAVRDGSWCLTIDGGRSPVGAAIKVAPWTGADNQKWQLHTLD